MSRLGDAVVDQGDGYIITSKEKIFRSFYILTVMIYKQFLLNITNLWQDYRVIIYEIGQEINSSFDQWKAMGKPDQLTDEEMELLKLSSIPSIKLSYKKETCSTYEFKNQGPWSSINIIYSMKHLELKVFFSFSVKVPFYKHLKKVLIIH